MLFPVVFRHFPFSRTYISHFAISRFGLNILLGILPSPHEDKLYLYSLPTWGFCSPFFKSFNHHIFYIVFIFKYFCSIINTFLFMRCKFFAWLLINLSKEKSFWQLLYVSFFRNWIILFCNSFFIIFRYKWSYYAYFIFFCYIVCDCFRSFLSFYICIKNNIRYWIEFFV